VAGSAAPSQHECLPFDEKTEDSLSPFVSTARFIHLLTASPLAAVLMVNSCVI
jgi:hypothetical protein